MNIYVEIPEVMISKIATIRRRLCEALQREDQPAVVTIYLSIPVVATKKAEVTIIRVDTYTTSAIDNFIRNLARVLGEITGLKVFFLEKKGLALSLS